VLTHKRPVSDRVTFALGVAAATALALALESFRLSASGLTFDEAATVTYAALDFGHLHAALQLSDAFFGAYYAWMHLWMRLGESEAVLRSFSVLCAAGAVVAIALLARRLAGTTAGIVAGFLAAASPLLFDVARQARPYSLLVLVAALSSLAFLRAAERPNTRRWLAYVVVCAIGSYVHVFLLLLVSAHSLWAALARPALYRRGLPPALVFIALSTVPLIAVLRQYPSVNIYIPRPTVRTLIDTFVWFAGSREIAALALVLLAVTVFVQLRRTGRITFDSTATFVIATAAVPPLIAFVESFVAKPSYMQRYLVEAWPACVIGFAILLTRVRPPPLAAVAVLAALVLAAHSDLGEHLNVAQNWRGASATIFANALPGDQIVVYPALGLLPYEYYRQHIRPPVAPKLRSPSSPPFPLRMYSDGNDKFIVDEAALDAAQSRPKRIWLLVGWTDDARTGAGLRTLTGALGRTYRLAYDRPLVHEEVLRFEPRAGGN
jgi:mannosyltransferase